MFDSPAPRLFGLAPGVDFPRALIDGLLARMSGQPPEALARVELFVNTRRMARRLSEMFDAGPARLLPRIRLVTDLATDAAMADLPPPVPPLRRRLELAQLISGLLDQAPEFAPRAAIFDLADSLAALMDEMQGEGVSPEAILKLDVSDRSGHWQRSLAFLSLVQRYFEASGDSALDLEARQRRVIERIAATWETAPPQHPVIVAGSTGSRGATAQFMEAVARLPQGAVVFPGFDFEMPAQTWAGLDTVPPAEDHPQYRAARLMAALGLDPGDVRPWHDTRAPSRARNRLVSLSLRPAPVTDQWLVEGPALRDLAGATAAVSLIEAPGPRAEALAIALCLREAVERGTSAALITPDRVLTRQVTAALDRWGIEPDDSAGRPLSLSAPGRFLRQIAGLFGRKLTAETLLALLKHPLCHTGANRGPHLLNTRELELWLRKRGPAFPEADTLRRWAADKRPEALGWAGWVGETLCGLDTVGKQPLTDHVDQHLTIAARLAAGPESTDDAALWEKPAGQAARLAVDDLTAEAAHGGTLSPSDYVDLFAALLNRVEVRDPVLPHPDVMIWGTLEARVQGAERVILAGLNDGTWPEQPPLDPWLNRAMRLEAGLLLPERRIGLSAHDFQQAIAAKEVILSRAIRDDEAETVPSRWLNRLTNLLGGLPGNGGPEALAAMRERGKHWVDLARALEAVHSRVPAAQRPSPRPPASARPRTLSVTQIKTLIRDPYAVYARETLGLRPLDPLHAAPDAPLRGTVIHAILEQFVPTWAEGGDRLARLMAMTDAVLATEVPWPAARRIWRARFSRATAWFLETEARRQAEGRVIGTERKGALALDPLDFTLKVKADRIDEDAGRRLVIYDYKTGNPPSREEQTHFDKQLLLTAALAERGAFEGLAAAPVRAARFIGLGPKPAEVDAPLDENPPDVTWAELQKLIAAYLDPAQGFTARRAMQKDEDTADYDHLARYGEWSASDPATPEDVG